MIGIILSAVLCQQTTVEDVLKLVEKNSAALEDLTFDVDTGARGGFAPGEHLSVTVTWKRGAGLRVRVVSTAKGAGAGMPFQIGGMELAYTKDAFYLWQPQVAPSLAASNLRLGWDQPAAKSFDPYWLPTGYPIRVFVDDPTIYYALDPRLFFGFEPNLAYEGKRVEEGKPHHVLSSYLAPSPLAEKLHSADFRFTSSRKEFFVEADTGRLAKLRWDISVMQSMGGRDEREQQGTLTATPGAGVQVGAGVALPSGSSWAFFDKTRGRNEAGEMTHTYKNWRANSGVAADSILNDGERADLYGDAVLLKAEEYEAAVKKDAKDATARYSLAIARATPSMMGRMMGRDAPPAKIADDLAKAMELRPGAESPVLNFIAAADAEGRLEEAQAVIAKIADGAIKGDRLRIVAAERLNAKGESDRVLKLLEAMPGRRATLERMFALASRKDGEALIGAFRAEAAKRPTTADKAAFVRELESRFASLPKDAAPAEALFADALAKQPDMALRLELARRRATPEAVAELVEAAPGDAAAVDFAVELLEARTEFAADGARRLREAMAKVTTTDPRVPFQVGRALKAAGLAEDAKREFGVALHKCAEVEAGKEGAQHVGATLYALSQEEGPLPADEWLEKVARALVRAAPHAEGLPPDAIWNEEKNPVVRLAKKYLDAEKWIEFYRLLTDAGERLVSPWTLRTALQGNARAECGKAVRELVLKDAKDTSPHRKYAEFASRFLEDEGAVEVLEQARALAPKDVSVLWLLAETAARRGERDKAAAAYEEAVPLLATPVSSEGRTFTRAHALLALARLQGATPKAKETLAKIDIAAKDADGNVVSEVGDEYSQREEWDLAIAAYLRARELGRRPYFRLGRAYEKKGEPYEALRWYNRDNELGSSRDTIEAQVEVAPPPVPGADEPAKPPPEREPTNGKEGRERLLKKLGTDWLIGKFLEQKFEPLSAEEKARLAKAVEQFRSDDLSERESGEADVRKIGPRAAPSLRDLLTAGDEEVKTRVRAILSEWAEPR